MSLNGKDELRPSGWNMHSLFRRPSCDDTSLAVQVTVDTWASPLRYVAADFAGPTVQTCFAGALADPGLEPRPGQVLFCRYVSLCLDRVHIGEAVDFPDSGDFEQPEL